MCGKRIFLSAVLALFFSTLLFSQNTIEIGNIVLYPETKKNRDFLDELLEGAAFMADRLYGEYIHTRYKAGGGRADYRLDINAVQTDDSSVMTLSLSGKASPDPYNLLSSWDTITSKDIAQIIFYLWASADNFTRFDTEEEPELLTSFSTDMIEKGNLPQGLVLYPYSVEVKAEGNILVGATSLALEFSPQFKLIDQPGKVLLEEGNYNFAYDMAVTPGGTIYARPSTGAEIYTFIPDAPRPIKVRTGISLAGAFTVLSDGSIIVVDAMKQRALRINGREKEELDIFENEYSTVTVIAAGPEGNLWVFDPVSARITIYSPEGKRLDTIIPMLPQADRTAIKALSVYQNGDFLVLTYNALIKIARNGAVKWRLDSLPAPAEGDFSLVSGIAVDSKNAFIYLTDSMGKKIYQLYDRSYAENRNMVNAYADTLADLNRKQVNGADSPDIYQEKAELFENWGSLELARGYWERIFEVDPFNAEAADRIDMLELKMLLSQAEEMRLKTLQVLNNLGPESARQDYSRTVQIYERILSIDPYNDTAQSDLRNLKEQFASREALPRSKPKPLTIVSIEMENLFPSLMLYYRQHPAGYVTVKNPWDQEVTNLKAVLSMRYMDYPSESAVIKKLAPGGQVSIPMTVLFNEDIFRLEEDMPVQAQISLSYSISGTEEQMRKGKTLTIYRRTALSWDDSGKLASFITPNEEVISRFSLRTADPGSMTEKYSISKKFFRASRIADALGKYDIAYIEDPDSPFSEVLGKESIVDTVRFPRTTLFYRTGDCDDTTALLASLYEASGIQTAIMTSPGHVFLAFNSEEPEENAWLFERDETEVMIHEDQIWIPVETTIIQEGFDRAWREASSLLRRYRSSGEIEFIPVAEERNSYPPLPLPQSGFEIIEPPPEQINEAFSATLDGIEDILYSGALSELRHLLSSSSGRRYLATINQIGILHAIFGYDTLAEVNFQKAIDRDEDYLSSYINMANLKLEQDNPAAAVRFLEKGKRIRPSSVLVNLLLAQAHSKLGEDSKVREYLEIVEERSPSLAERYAGILIGSGASRASGAEQEIPKIWAAEEE